MKLANVDGRATIVPGNAGVDVATASEGRFGPDVQLLYDQWSEFLDFAADLTGEGGEGIDESRLCSPVPAPGQAFAIGLNYRAHAEESGMALPEFPTTFTKFPAGLSGPFDDIEIAFDMVDWEVDLVEDLSSVVPLLPGDVIFTGTPGGVGASRQPPGLLSPRDTLTRWIEGIGSIRNACTAPGAD